MYEHSIGAAILVNIWGSSLHDKFPFLVSQQDVVTVTVAVLLRNVGCMPWDRAFREFMCRRGDTRKMEHSSARIAVHMLESCHADINVGLVRDLITGNSIAGGVTFDLVNSTFDAVFIDRLLRSDARLGLRAGPQIRHIIDNSWIEESHLILSPSLITSITELKYRINTIVMTEDMAAISAAIQHAWGRCEWIGEAAEDMAVLMRTTDLTFKCDLEFAFFHNDMLAKRFPKLVETKHFLSQCGADTFMQTYPLPTSKIYHVSKSTSAYIVREFYFS
jgi:hypothetical protein